MTEGPVFIDNRDGNTLVRALEQVIPANGSQTAKEQRAALISIATAYFSPAGFARIADRLAEVRETRLLLGADIAAGDLAHKQLHETPSAYEHRRLSEGLGRIDSRLRYERDRMPFTRGSRVAIGKLVEALKSGNMPVRRYEKAFLHAKAYIFASEEGEGCTADGVIAGSSNLTEAGMAHNLELNLGRYDEHVAAKAQAWFDELWEEAEPYDLADLFEEILLPHSPWAVFIQVLWRLYGSEIGLEEESGQNLPLTNFQIHGAARALRLLLETGGVLVSDEVGLGKTFIAGEIIQRYIDQRQRILVLCPAALRESTWRKFLAKYKMLVECLSFDQLANDKQLRDARRPNANAKHLLSPLAEYQLIVVDEAHNYRNPNTPTRAGVLRSLLFGPHRDLLLLTATPVNNSLWDLYYLLRFFLRQDTHLAKRGIVSIRQRFQQAMQTDPSDLNPDLLYPIIDATTVKRTRQFVMRHYEGDKIKLPDGTREKIVFPKPIAISVRYNLDDALPGFFDDLEEALNPDGAGRIAFARYTPDVFLLQDADPVETAQKNSVAGLLRSGLLKRFESSACAFANTAGKMVRQHEAFLAELEQGYVVDTEFLRELSANDEEEMDEIVDKGDQRKEARHYDVARLRRAVEHDLDMLRLLAAKAKEIKPGSDPKLRALAHALADIAAQAKREMTDSIDEAQKRKVLIFSYFADTVDWIRAFLAKEFAKDGPLAPYAGRMVAVSGPGVHGEDITRLEAVQGFAPVSMEARAKEDADLYDVLISTDVLAEGVNLQQCRNIINFDMPWNPMRLVQRHGRIDRIGSPHDSVYLRTIFPADRLDQLLNLEQRILAKLAMAAASIGVSAPIERAAHGSQVFTEARAEIEKLIREDPSLFINRGTAAAAQTGEEYRQTLRKALASDRARIENMPWKIGAGMAKGPQRGFFFCAAVGDRTFLRFVSADDHGRPQKAEEAIVREEGTCLRMVECEKETPAHLFVGAVESVYDFWEVAQEDIHGEWMAATDPSTFHPKIAALNSRVVQFIRNNRPKGIAEDDYKRAIGVLENTWPRAESVLLRGWFESMQGNEAQQVRSLIDNILELGLAPYEQPPLLPPIELDDVELYCWMAIERAGGPEQEGT